MEPVRLTIEIKTETRAALEQVSRSEGTGVEEIVRDAIRRDLFRRTRAKKPVRADERLVAPLRALLADDLAFATGWRDLQSRLSAKGYAFREAGGGLVLVRLPSGDRVAKASELGYSYSKLARRFDAPFPGHRHRYLFGQPG